MNAESFISSFSVAAYIPSKKFDQESDYLSSLSSTQATLYFEQKVQRAQNASIMYKCLERKKYYVVLSKDRKTFQMVRGSDILNFTIRVISFSEIYRVAKRSSLPQDVMSLTCEIETIFTHEVEAWRVKVDEYISNINSVCEVSLLEKLSLTALHRFVSEEKVFFLEKAEKASDPRLKNKNLLRVLECSLRIDVLSNILRSKGSW